MAFELVAFEQLGPGQVGGLVEAEKLVPAQQLARAELGHQRALVIGAARILRQALAFHLQSNAPLRHTYTKATNRRAMKTIVSASA